jgi:hypothetical protein
MVDGRKVQLLEGDVLKENERIITEEKGRIVLLCDDGSVIRLSENTDILLSSLKTQEIKLTEESGVIFARVQKDRTHKFIIAVGDLTVSSEGTAFLVEKQDRVKVSVFESSVKVDDEGKEIKIEESQEWQEGMDKAMAIDSKKLSNNEFINWSLSEEKLSKIPTVTPVKVKEVSENVNQIKLSAEAVSGGINLNWIVYGIDVSRGFKLIKNSTGSPSYPSDAAIYVDANTREYYWKTDRESIWHVRVCQYTGEGCGVYSNEVVIKALDSGQSSVKSISLSGNIDGGIAKLTWTIDGNSSMGYKVVWSKNSGPTYPLRDGDEFIYISNPDEKSTKITGLSAGWNYYIRVCEYLGGKCGIYSNEITLKY